MAKKIFTVVFAVLLIAAILFCVCYYVGSRPEKFSVLYDGNEVTDKIGGIGVSFSEPLELEVTGTYTCTVIPREGVKVTFVEGEKNRSLSEFSDVTAGFRFAEGEDNKLTVTPVGGLSAVITAVTGRDATVGKYDDAADLFTLLIRSEDGKEIREIHFGLYHYDVDGVRLSDEEISF